MPRSADETPRVLGPTWLPSRQSWRVTTVDPGAAEGASRKRDRYFADEEEAQDYRNLKAEQLARLNGMTVAAALDAFENHLGETNNDNSRTEKMRRLRLFFGDVCSLQLARLSADRAERLYRVVNERGELTAGFMVGRSADYHRNTLGSAKGFLEWCVEGQKWIAVNPLAAVKGRGKRSSGKPQLTGDEARKLFQWLLWKAQRRAGDLERRDSDAAIALLLVLCLALRQRDVIRRQVRDVDLDGTVFRVEGGKTKKSNRPRAVPPVLRELLHLVVAGRSPLEPLFVGLDGDYHTRAWLLAALKRFCVDASVPVICVHALKGVAGTVLAETGELGSKIADHLSHDDQKTTQRSYVDPGVVAAAAAERGFAVISGGR
jgi:integrase